jgi:hypothetical protein
MLTLGIVCLVTFCGPTFTGGVDSRHISHCNLLVHRVCLQSTRFTLWHSDCDSGAQHGLGDCVILDNLMQYGTILINSVFSIAESFFKRLTIFGSSSSNLRTSQLVPRFISPKSSSLLASSNLLSRESPGDSISVNDTANCSDESNIELTLLISAQVVGAGLTAEELKERGTPRSPKWTRKFYRQNILQHWGRSNF